MVIQLVLWHEKTTKVVLEWRKISGNISDFPFYSISSQKQAVVNFQSLFTLLWAPCRDQSGLHYPKEELTKWFNIGRIWFKGHSTTTDSESFLTKNIHHSRKGPIPGNAFRFSFLSSSSFKINSSQSHPKIMFNGICSPTYTDSSKLSFGSGTKNHSLGLTRS